MRKTGYVDLCRFQMPPYATLINFLIRIMFVQFCVVLSFFETSISPNFKCIKIIEQNFFVK